MKRFTLYLLNALGRLILRKFRPTVIGVTGSVGKTTTKDLIHAAIKDQKRSRRAEGSQNAEWGVFLALVGYRKTSDAYTRLRISELLQALWLGIRSLFGKRFPEVVVLEMGADRPGDISYLTRFYPPDVAVLTNIGPSHLVNFPSLGAIAAEKGTLVRALPRDGVAVLNHDDPLVRTIGENWGGRVIWYGTEQGADLQAVSVESKPEGVSYRLEAGEESYPVKLSARGGGGVFASLAALGVARALGLDLRRAVAALREVQPAKHRLNVLTLTDLTIIDDTYNASPASMKTALDYLATFPGRKVAVLGEMRELGPVSEEAHREVGEWAARIADEIVVIGAGARGICEAAGEKAAFLPDVEAAIRELPRRLKGGDVVLAKASRGVYLERLVEALAGRARKKTSAGVAA